MCDHLEGRNLGNRLLPGSTSLSRDDPIWPNLGILNLCGPSFPPPSMKTVVETSCDNLGGKNLEGLYLPGPTLTFLYHSHTHPLLQYIFVTHISYVNQRLFKPEPTFPNSIEFRIRIFLSIYQLFH